MAGQTLQLKSLHAKKDSKVFLLGDNGRLHWHQDEHGLVIEIPKRLQNKESRPCLQAYVFKIEKG